MLIKTQETVYKVWSISMKLGSLNIICMHWKCWKHSKNDAAGCTRIECLIAVLWHTTKNKPSNFHLKQIFYYYQLRSCSLLWCLWVPLVWWRVWRKRFQLFINRYTNIVNISIVPFSNVFCRVGIFVLLYVS